MGYRDGICQTLIGTVACWSAGLFGNNHLEHLEKSPQEPFSILVCSFRWNLWTVLKRANPKPKRHTGQDYGLYYIGQRIKCGQGRLVSRQILQTSCRMCRFLLMMRYHPFILSGAPCRKSHPVVVVNKRTSTLPLVFSSQHGASIWLHPLMKHPFHCTTDSGMSGSSAFPLPKK